MSQTTILLADDSSTVRTMVNKILTEAGYRVISASDGTSAVELARIYRPDLAIIDIMMPELDGYGVCEQLKLMGSPWEDLPILFLTCVKSKALELLGNEYGAYLNKPVCSEQLLSTIDRQLSRTA